MILLWNRKEVYHGFSMPEFIRIKELLIIKGITYDLKIVNRNTASVFDTSRNRLGSLGVNDQYSNEYYIFVHKNDCDEAVYIINNSKM